MKMSEPMPDGNIAYVHVITPVVAGADYIVIEARSTPIPV
jgi:hypothetical protein